MTQVGGGTKIGLALTSIKEYFEASRGSRRSAKISQNLVLITDGDSQDDVEGPADELEALGIEMFAIGIGNVHDLELLQITGTPERLFTVRNFDSLKKVKEKVVKIVCESKEPSDKTGEFKKATASLISSVLILCLRKVNTPFPLLQTAPSTSPWGSISLRGRDGFLRSCPTCQRSFSTFHQYQACAAWKPSSPTLGTEW